jgi:hypothetical protein
LKRGKTFFANEELRLILGGLAITVILVLISQYNYLLFHILAESFSIIVAFAMFVLVWNTWELTDNAYLQFLGLAFFFIGGLDMVHTLAYKGMDIFTAHDANLPTQLWIATRYLQSLTLLIAPFFLTHKLRNRYIPFGIYAGLSTVLLGLIFTGIFPDCYIEGQGLTPFKIASEYAISAILVAAILRLFNHREAFAPDVFRRMVIALSLTIVSELAFTFYVSVYGISNLVGHIFKFFAFYFIYRAIVETGLRRPYDLLFRDLQQRNTQLEKEITERKQAENALRTSEREKALILNATKEMIVYHNPNLEVQWANQASADSVGCSVEELVGLHCYDIWHQRDEPCEDCPVLKAFETGEDQETEITTPDGRIWLLRAYPVSEDGEVVGAVEVGQNITERKQAQEKIAHYAANLERSNRDLEQFAHVISHDLREPTRVIKSYLNLLERRYKGQLDEKADKFITYAVDGAERMQEMIQALLNLSRAKTEQNNLAPTDSEEVLSRTLMALEQAMLESGTEVTHGPLPTVMADSAQLGQVFQNIIANAIKFRREDVTPRVHISATRQAKAGSGEGKKTWVFAIEDNGIGIDPKHNDRIFQIFQRLHTREEYPGTGIGLALCKRIVEQHGGNIWVESEPGEGATFYFTLPASHSAS